MSDTELRSCRCGATLQILQATIAKLPPSGVVEGGGATKLWDSVAESIDVLLRGGYIPMRVVRRPQLTAEQMQRPGLTA